MASTLFIAARSNWRRFSTIVWLILFSALIPLFLYRSRADIAEARPLLADAQLRWVLGAFGAQLVMLALVANKYCVLLGTLDYRFSRWTLARFHLRRHFVSTIIPVGGPAGLMNFVRDMGRHRISASTAVYCSFLGSVVNEIAFGLFMVPVLTYLTLAGRATLPMIVGSLALLVVVFGGIATVLAMLRNGRFRSTILSHLPEKFVKGIAEASAHGLTARDILPAVPFSLGVNICSVTMLSCSLWAVGQHPSLTTILAARVLASVTMLLLPMWQGAGAMEVTVAGTLIASGVPAPAAIAAITLFRIAQFWLPMAMGAAMFVPFEPTRWSAWERRAGFAGAASCVAVLAVILAT